MSHVNPLLTSSPLGTLDERIRAAVFGPRQPRNTLPALDLLATGVGADDASGINARRAYAPHPSGIVDLSSPLVLGALAVTRLPALSGLSLVDPAMADSLAGYDASGTVNARFEADRLLGLTRLAPGGRLTLTSGNPLTTSDVTSAGNVYYTPYRHDMICLWDGTRWAWITFTETALAVGVSLQSLPYDVFGYLSGGALATEMLQWTSDTVRATAVTYQDGRLCKSGDKTRLLLGTFRAKSASEAADSGAQRYLDDLYYPRGSFGLSTVVTDQSTTSSTAADLTTADTINFVLCQAAIVNILYIANVYQSTTGANCHDVVLVDASSIDAVDWGAAAANTGAADVLCYSREFAAGKHSVNIQHSAVGGGTAHWRNRTLTAWRV